MMRVTVNEDKIRAELTAPPYRRVSDHRPLLSARELQVFIARLRGGESHAAMARGIGITPHNFSIVLHRIREMLELRDEFELALFAYERGYVFVEDV